MGIRKYFGDRKFYKMVLGIAIPIMLQNAITNFVNLLDNIMVGNLGTEAVSGVAIVNQLFFVFALCVFGLLAGAGIFTAQFHGKRDEEGVKKTFRIKLVFVLAVSVAALLLFLFFKDWLISLYLSEGKEGDLALTLEFGREYLSIMAIGMIPYALVQAYASTMRETEHAVLPTVAGFIAVLFNCVGNYVLIFGKLGLPAMGVKGAAVATVISRVIELLILLIVPQIRRNRFSEIVGTVTFVRKPDWALLKQVVVKGFPLLINETAWATGMSALVQVYSTRGLDVVAGVNIANTFINLFNIAALALGTSVGIIVGKYLGACEFETAVDTDRKMIVLATLTGLGLGLLMFGFTKIFPVIYPYLYKTSDAVLESAVSAMTVAACFMPVVSFLHACYFTIRSGGKTWITFAFDSVYVCLLNYPVVLLVSKLTDWPFIGLFILSNLLDLIKCTVGFILVKKKKWVQKIV
ncbi:MAG: MATE family efflux transporter [Clostridia bacterium]|nr:MATE family efflux transporter [Clostridia bacterium]